MLLVSLVTTALLPAGLQRPELTEGVVQRPDARLHYKVVGKRGPYVLLLAGGPGVTAEFMRPIADRLKDRYRCVLLEQRGTDRSTLRGYDREAISFDQSIADLEAVRRHLGQKETILIGNSWGMMLALAYAAAHPTRAAAVVSLGSGYLNRAQKTAWNERLEARLTPEQVRRLAEVFQNTTSREEEYIESFKVIAPAYFAKPEVAQAFLKVFRPEHLNASLAIGSGAAWMLSTTDKYVADRLTAIRCPVLLVQGKQDLAPEETATFVRTRVARAKVVFLENCGHFPWLDQPNATWRELNGFLGSVTKKR